MKLPKEITTVTPLSKIVALLMFVLLPVAAYMIGENQGRAIQTMVESPPIPVTASLPPTFWPTIEQPQPSPVPQTYDFSESLEMKSIGAKALFPAGTKLTLQETNMYVAKIGNDDTVTFILKNYDGKGRRAWFAREYPFTAKYTIEPFQTSSHEGYIAYASRPEDTPGSFFYFTSVNGSTMFVVNGFNYGGANSVFFSSDINKFKQFLTNLKFINKTSVKIENTDISHVYRYSDNRITLWEDKLAGIKITGPEWTEFRVPSGQYDTDGRAIYNGDWNHTVSGVREYKLDGTNGYVHQVDVQGGFAPYISLSILSDEYNKLDFSGVVSKLLLPSGFCSSEWKESKSICTDSNYCYTRQEVLNNLIVKKNIKSGGIAAELRSMNQSFSSQNDCRAEDTWLIKTKDGRFISTDLNPDGQDFRWEIIK